MKANNKDIIAAVKKNRGGYDNATDQQVLAVWNTLDAETQKQYLEKTERKEK